MAMKKAHCIEKKKHLLAPDHDGPTKGHTVGRVTWYIAVVEQISSGSFNSDRKGEKMLLQ